jgi:TRAP-type C4-dicarboxylate transport system permease small subunit
MYRVLEKLSKVENILASTFIAIMTVLVIIDVLMREVMQSGLPWAQKASVYLMIWGGFWGPC